MKYRIAVVGMGPRGLHAVEVLSRALNDVGMPSDYALLLFDDSGYPGCGPNYAPDQLTQNILNIPCREVPLPQRETLNGKINIPGFPGYLDWQDEYENTDRFGRDVFPARASIGRYLQARFQSWLTAWREQAPVELIERSVVAINHDTQQLALEDDHGKTYDQVSHTLLTIGHQPTERDPVLQRWVTHVEHEPKLSLFEDPYPTRIPCESSRIRESDTVAIRGLGLSMIDVVKSMTEGRGGRFEALDDQGARLHYLASAQEPALMVPFSLDGLPMSPKPVNEEFDGKFCPTEHEHELLESRLSPDNRPAKGEALKNMIVETMASIASGVYQRLGERRLINDESDASLAEVIVEWLKDESFTHRGIIAHEMATRDMMQRFHDMAMDSAPVSIDYCVGQVWRQCQKTLYRHLAHAGPGSAVLVPHIKLDSRLKRYAFGPPVQSTARLLALCDANLLRFVLADDPDIELSSSGWKLADNGQAVMASVMIDTVLASPATRRVSSPLVKNLHASGIWDVVDEKLGICTVREGYFEKQVSTPGAQKIALIGRLATGSVVEADALMECFGPELDSWARSVVNTSVVQE